MARFHIYPVREGNSYRSLKSIVLMSDHDFPSGANYYSFKAGVADSGGVNYEGEFDGSTQKITANVPLVLVPDTSVPLLVDQSVVLDVTSSGLPADLAGTTVMAEIYHTLKEPAHRVQDQVIRSAVDGLADYLISTRSGVETVSLALPRQIETSSTRVVEHEEDASSVSVVSATYVASNISITVSGSTLRPTNVLVQCNATFEGQLGLDTLFVAISDGTTNQNPHGQWVSAGGGTGHVGTTFSEQIVQSRTYTLMFRQAGGNPLVTAHSMTIIAMEA